MSEVSLDGRLTGNPDGVMKEEVNMKNINKRKMISVMEDMLNDASTLCLD
ncbi:hypothetical protein C943_01013 [Mariniradius saccharolyticus AK6]|uniref:Uncharacterized protein n=1 Tax=Mariniradius saccharolyticus AK6 TaxID=1239962 RepID=M7X5C1_9BACT|nr:hypothetical protein C943_01013 [Mariniradius saccharolyticus AK6]